MKTSVLRWELVGIPVILIVGSILHFAFEWSGGWEPLGVIAAVNESVWEHFKIGFWPALFYALLEYRFLRKSVNNFVFAKAIGIYVIPITIALLFYSYTAIIGEEILIADIVIFVLAVALGQLMSYKLLTSKELPRWSNIIGFSLPSILAIAFECTSSKRSCERCNYWFRGGQLTSNVVMFKVDRVLPLVGGG